MAGDIPMRRQSDPTDLSVLSGTVQQMHDEQIRQGERLLTQGRHLEDIKTAQSTYATKAELSDRLHPLVIATELQGQQIKEEQKWRSEFLITWTKFSTEIITTGKNTRWILGGLVTASGVALGVIELYSKVHH